MIYGHNKYGRFAMYAPDDGTGAGGGVGAESAQEAAQAFSQNEGMDDNTDDIANQIFNSFSEPQQVEQKEKKEEPAEEKQQQQEEENPEAPSSEPTEGTAEPEALELSDDKLVKVGDQTVPFSVFREALAKSTATEETAQRVSTELQTLSSAAAGYKQMQEGVVKFWQDQFDELAKIDPFQAARQMTPENYAAYAAELDRVAKGLEGAKNDLTKVTEASKAVDQHIIQQESEQCIAALMDPVRGIPGFKENPQGTYAKLAEYATKSCGIPVDAFNNIRDPLQLKILDKAMRYDAGMASLAKAASAVKAKVSTTGTPANKGSSGESADGGSKGATSSPAFQRLKQTGSLEDATAAIMASMGITE